MYAMEGGSMITNVHKRRCRQYSKASLDRQVTQNGLGVINVMAREYTMEGYHDTKMVWRLPSLAMMSGGDLDGHTKMMETRP